MRDETEGSDIGETTTSRQIKEELRMNFKEYPIPLSPHRATMGCPELNFRSISSSTCCLPTKPGLRTNRSMLIRFGSRVTFGLAISS